MTRSAAGLVACVALLGAGTPAAPAADDQAAPIDIPSQALTGALERFSVLTGWQVAYRGTLAADQQSVAVQGERSPDAALQRLLTGAHLVAHHLGPDSVVIERAPAGIDPDAPPAPEPQDEAAALPFYPFYGALQSRLTQALCADARVRGAGRQLTLGLRITPAGAVSRALLLSSTGDPRLDAAIERDAGQVVTAPPPGELTQPILIVISAGLKEECARRAAESQRRERP